MASSFLGELDGLLDEAVDAGYLDDVERDRIHALSASPVFKARLPSLAEVTAQHAILLGSCPVVVHGIVNQPELNGSHGMVVGAATAGRLQIRTPTGRTLSLRMVNLRLPPKPSAEEAAALLTLAEKDDVNAANGETFEADGGDGEVLSESEDEAAAEQDGTQPTPTCRVCLSEADEVRGCPGTNGTK